MGEEAFGYAFDHNEVRSKAGEPYNRAAFKLHVGGSHPSDCRVQLADEKAPSDHGKTWEGQMLVEGQARQVVFYRKNGTETAAAEPSKTTALSADSFGDDVAKWQLFLTGQGFNTPVTGAFDGVTETATKAFQRKHRLFVDGRVGNESYGRAASLGLELVDFVGTPGSGYPPPPPFPALTSTADRERMFGRFQYQPDPTAKNPERIRILGDWVRQHIVTVPLPQLLGIKGAPRDALVQVHRLAEEPITALWAAWEKAKLLDRVLSWDGAFVPRFVRGSRSVLSNHAFGTAFDINAAYNRLGAEPAWPKMAGCVFDLVDIAHKHGFYWGGHFKHRRDGMHFELAVIPARSGMTTKRN